MDSRCHARPRHRARISALAAFEAAFLERQAFEEHFQVDVLLGDVTWETSYGLPGEGQRPRVVAHVAFDWPSWSQTAYRRCYVDELDTPPAIEMEIVLRIQRLAETPNVERVYESLPTTSVLVGDGRLERAGLTVEVAHPDPSDPDDTDQSYALEVTYEGLYEARRGDARRRDVLGTRRALRRPRWLGRLDARAPRRSALRLPPSRRLRRRVAAWNSDG